MNKTTRLALAAFAALTLAANAVDQRLVFVNMEKVFSEYYKTKQADAQLKTQADSFKTERKKMVEDFQKQQDIFNKLRDEAQNTALSEDARNKKRNEAEEKLVTIREMENRIRRYDDSKQRELDDQSKRMRKDIVAEIREQLTGYARSMGYSAILDSSGDSMNLVPIVLYADPTTDITDAVVALVNKGKARPDEPAKTAPLRP